MDDEKWKELFAIPQKRKRNTFIQSLLDAGLDVNALNKNGTTMLSHAAECGSLEIIDLLVQNGADGNVTNSDGSKPLHIAAKNGHKDIVEFFINRDIFVDSRDNDNCTPLHYVALKRNIPLDSSESYQELVHFLIDNNADLNAVNRIGCTPLLLAAQNSRQHIVELFIKLGANVELCDEHQWTVLHHSSEKGWSRIVLSLIEGRFDIDINARTSQGYTSLIIAAQSSRKGIVQSLMYLGYKVELECKGFEDRTLLHYACEKGWIEAVQYLVNKGCDLNAKTTVGCTPLFFASKYSRFNIADFLIEVGADGEGCDHEKHTVLHFAAIEGWLNVVEYLVSKGCDLNAKTSIGITPLLFAAQNSHSNIVEYLIKCGADVQGCDQDGYTILHFVCIEGWPDLVKSLVKIGFNVNVQNDYLETPLHFAANAVNLKVIENLLKAGADCNIESKWGETAFNEFMTVSSQSPFYVEGIALFLENGAYFRFFDNIAITQRPILKASILQDSQLCTQAVMNKFNNVDLPKIYQISVVAEQLPPIKKMKISSYCNVAQNITERVKYEIQSGGYCNVLHVRLLPLNILSVRSLVAHYYN